MTVFFACLLLLSLLLGYVVFSLFKYTRMISRIFLDLVFNPASEPVTSGRGERLTVLDSSDKEIEALFVECKGSRRMVIFCHESGLTKESWERYAYFLPARGFHLLSVDLDDRSRPPEDQLRTQWPTQPEVQRLLTVIRWAKHAIGPEMRIFLFGVSKGADVAFAASFSEPAVKAVIADGLFSLKEVFRDYIRRWAPVLVKPNLFGEKYPAWVVNLFSSLGFWYSQKKSKAQFVEVEHLLSKTHVPLLMIHGEEDDYVPVSHQHFLEKLGRKQETISRLVIPKAKHNQAVVLGRETYEQKILNFLDSQ